MNEIETEKIKALLDALITEHQSWIDNLTPLRLSIDNQITLLTTPLNEKIISLTNERDSLTTIVAAKQAEIDELKIATEVPIV